MKFSRIMSIIVAALIIMQLNGCKTLGSVTPESVVTQVTVVQLIKSFDKNSVSARALLTKTYADKIKASDIEFVTTKLDSVLNLRSIVNNPRLDFIAKLTASCNDHYELKDYIKVNWAHIKRQHKPFISSFINQLDTGCETLANLEAKATENDKAKLVLTWLNTANTMKVILKGSYDLK